MVALVVAVAVVVAIAVFAGSNATIVAIVLVAVLAAIAAVVAVIGKSRTGLGITPEWKPDPVVEDDDRDDDAQSPVEQDRSDTNGDPAVDETEPIRRLDAQILGEDLAKLGQVVSQRLARSYSVGTLVLEDSMVVWEPGATSRAAGIEELSTAPAQVSEVQTAPLWGAWALLRVATTEGDEWCMRVPGSVDLSPAFAEMGLTVRKVT